MAARTRHWPQGKIRDSGTAWLSGTDVVKYCLSSQASGWPLPEHRLRWHQKCGSGGGLIMIDGLKGPRNACGRLYILGSLN